MSANCVLCEAMKNVPPGPDGLASAWTVAFLTGRSLERAAIPTEAVMCTNHNLFAAVLRLSVDGALKILTGEAPSRGTDP